MSINLFKVNRVNLVVLVMAFYVWHKTQIKIFTIIRVGDKLMLDYKHLSALRNSQRLSKNIILANILHSPFVCKTAVLNVKLGEIWVTEQGN